MAEEWLSSGFGLPATYTGSEFNDGGTGLSLFTSFSTIAAGYITHVRFWKTSIDTATSRTIVIYKMADHSLVTSQVTSGEPVGTAQWITVALTTPIPVTAAPVLTNNYYVGVEYNQRKYPATAAVFSTGYYSATSKLYAHEGFEAIANGGAGNGAFNYGPSIAYPDEAFNNGYYWVDVKWADSLGGSVDLTAFQIDAFQPDAFQMMGAFTMHVTEGPDVAHFEINVNTKFNFAISEGPDVAHFDLTSRTKFSFAITEGPDVAHFDLTSRTKFSFAITEGPDVPAFEMRTGLEFSFDIVEGPDVAAFRMWHGDFTLGDADYIVVPLEGQTILVPPTTEQAAEVAIVPAEQQTILVPAEQNIIQIHAEGRDTNVPDEWQRVDIDQTRGRRRNNETE